MLGAIFGGGAAAAGGTAAGAGIGSAIAAGAAVAGTVATIAGVRHQMAAAEEAQAAARERQRIAQENAAIAASQVGQYEQIASNEAAITAQRVREEQRRASANLLRLQEEKRRQVSRQRAQFAANGLLSSSPSADMLIGELGDNLQSRIQDVFVEAAGRQAAIQREGQRRYFDNLQRGYDVRLNAYEAFQRSRASGYDVVAAGRQRTAAFVGGIGNIARSTYQLGKTFA